MHDALFREQPWFANREPAADSVVGMLGQREANLFHDLAEHAWTGKGTIVDAGSFLGKSAVCFVEGLSRNAAFDPGRHRVHCFDDFLCRDEATVRIIANGFSETIAIGDGTRPFFDQQVAFCANVLEVHDQDFHRVDWSPEPIEILMIDIAKTQSLGQKVTASFFEHLIPGHSLVAHQDYHHIWLPHIHVVMEFLHESFELVAPRVDYTTVFAMTAPLDPAKLQRAIRYDFTDLEQQQLMARAIERMPPDERAMLELASLFLDSRTKDPDELLRRHTQIAKRHRHAKVHGLQDELDTVADLLLHGRARRFSQRGDHTAALAQADELLAQDEHSRDALLLRARALLDLGRNEESRQSVQALQQLPPQELGNRLELAQVLVGLGEHQQAEPLLVGDLLAQGPALPKPGHYLDLLCTIWEHGAAAETTTPSRCENVLKQLQTLLPDDPEVALLAARVAFLLGDVDTARRELRQGIALGLCERRAEEVLAPLGITISQFLGS